MGLDVDTNLNKGFGSVEEPALREGIVCRQILVGVLEYWSIEKAKNKNL